MWIIRALLLVFTASMAMIPAASLNAAAFCEIAEPPSPLPTQVNGTHVEIQLTEGYARIVIIKEFYNPSGIFKEGQIFFPLERGHELITDLRLQVGDVVYESTSQDRSEALSGFLEALATEQDAALVQYDPDRDVYWIAVTIPPKEARTTITTLEMPLSQKDGFYTYKYRLSVDAGHSVEYLRVHVRVETSAPLHSVEFPSHPGLEVLRPGNRVAEAYVNSTAEALGNDLSVRFRSEGTSVSQHLDGATGDRYFRFSVDASDPVFRDSLRPLPRSFLFLVDGSGSMGHDGRWGLARDAVSLLAADLKASETYAVTVFQGPETKIFSSVPREWSIADAISVRGWLDTIHPRGSTNLALAFPQLESWAQAARGNGRQPVLFLVSDGKATVSDRGLELENAFKRISYGNDLPVFALAVQPASQEEENLLRNLSHYNGGASVIVRSDNLRAGVAAVLDAIRVPVLHNVRFAFPSADTAVLATLNPQRVLDGGEALVVAKLPEAEQDPVTVKMSWTSREEETHTLLRTYFGNGVVNQTLTKRQWVLNRVHGLLDEVLVTGRQDTLATLKDLATESRVVTPYTSLLITIPRPGAETTTLDSALSTGGTLGDSIRAGGAASAESAASRLSAGFLFDPTILLDEDRRAESLRSDLSNPLVIDHEVDRYVVAGSLEHVKILRDRAAARFEGNYLTIYEVNGELIGVASGPLTPVGMVLRFAWNGVILVLTVLLFFAVVKVHHFGRRLKQAADYSEVRR